MEQVVLLMRVICKGERTRELAAELHLNYKTVLTMRHRVQANAELEQPTTILPNNHSETDEMFQNAGKKGELHPDPDDPPRKRANQQRGHGTYDHDRPPIVGTVGRESGQVRLRVIHNTDRKTLEAHVHRFTRKETTCYTGEWQSYNHIFENIQRFAMQNVNGLVMMTAMGFEKCTRTRRKACGPMYEITYVLSRVFTRRI